MKKIYLLSWHMKRSLIFDNCSAFFFGVFKFIHLDSRDFTRFIQNAFNTFYVQFPVEYCILQ